LSQLKSLFPILKHPSNHDKAAGFTPEEFHYAFTNTLSAEESKRVYDRYHVPAPASWIWAYGVFANITPGHQDTWVDYNFAERAPLLFIAGGQRSHHAGLGESLEREALQGEFGDRCLRVPWSLALHVRRAGVGARGRLRAVVGGGALEAVGGSRLTSAWQWSVP
jgi:hypothetical protein